jgi:hypothetical protein
MITKHRIAAAAVALAVAAGTVVVTAGPASAAPSVSTVQAKAKKVYTKTFYDWGACGDFYWNPPKGIHPDFWYGCKLVGPGYWEVKYTKD